MGCKVCSKEQEFPKAASENCIVEYLDKLRLHFVAFESEVQEKNSQIATLSLLNSELTETVLKLQEDLLNEDNKKRRKTNSFDSPDRFMDITNNITIKSDKSTSDYLNHAINIDSEWEDSMIACSQPPPKSVSTRTQIKTEMEKKSPTSPLSSVFKNKLNVIDTTPEKKPFIPEKSKTSLQAGNEENKNPANTTTWMSKTNRKVRNRRDWKCSSVDNVNKTSPPIKKSPPAAKKFVNKLGSRRLRQSTLQFDVQKDATLGQDQDTYCDDLVDSSLNNSKKQPRLRTLKKLNRQKSSEHSLFAFGKDVSLPKNDNSIKIKEEPLTAKRKSPIDLSTITSNNIREDSNYRTVSSDVFIHPTKPKEVFVIEDDTEADLANKIDSEVLLEGLMQKPNFRDSDFDCSFNCDKSLNLDELKKINRIEESTSSKIKDNNKKPSLLFDCKECQAYADFYKRHMNEYDVIERLKGCTKHNKPAQLHETPEGFWNPAFPPTEETSDSLINTRFLDQIK